MFGLLNQMDFINSAQNLLPVTEEEGWDLPDLLSDQPMTDRILAAMSWA